jgi:hypothetical protein
MAKNITTYSNTNQPAKGRGPAFKTLLLDAVRRDSLLDLPEGASRAQTEEAYISHLAKRAFDTKDPNSTTLLRETLRRMYAGIKDTLPSVKFEFDEKKPPADQVAQIIRASSEGIIPADVAGIFIQAVKSHQEIQLATEIKERVERLEATANGG